MANDKRPAVPHISVTTAADDKWQQQVRLACVQAASARAVAAQAAYNPEAVISVAKALADFVINGANGD